MDVDVAAKVLAGSILTGMAFVVFVITIIVINNLLHKYWKPVNFGYFMPRALIEDPKRFATEEEIRAQKETSKTV